MLYLSKINDELGRDFMGIVAVNMKKIKASTNVNSLLGENYRTDQDAKKYDDGHRNIDTDKTVDNVFLIDRPEDYDNARKAKIESINVQRAGRVNPKLMLKNQKRALKESGKLQAEATRGAVKRRKLRSDTVDTIGEVVQPDADFINGLSHDDQIRFFSDALAVIRDNPDYFGKPETAVIHFDETTPHMQVLASTLNETTLTSDAKKIMGNKSKMSKRQDVLAEGMQAKGWDVERGMKRVDNPDYQNWKSEAEAKGFVVTRTNDRQLQRQMAQAEAEADKKRREADKYLTEAKSSYGATTADLDAREQQVREKEEQVQHNDLINKTNAEINKKNAEKLKEYQKALNGRESSLEAREGDLEDKDRQADEKLLEASRMHQMAENLMNQVEQAKRQFENMKERLEQTWERVIKQVKRGALKPEAVEERVKKYDPLTDDNMPDLTDSLNDLSDSVDNDNQINM